MATKKKMSFEAQLAALEKLIGDMESGESTLEESMKRYEDGMKLIGELENELAQARQKLTVLRAGDEEELLEDAP